VEFQGYRVIQKEGEFDGLQVLRAVAVGGERHVQIRAFPPVLNRFPLLLEQFRTNFNILSHLQHPGICPVIDLSTKAGQCYVILPYVVAGNLADRFRSGFHAGLEVSQVINEIADSLDCAHQKGVIHGNLTPDNVLIDEEGHIHIVGFGEAAILRALPSTGGHAKQVEAKIAPPEASIASKLSPATDQYSLALIALRLLSGLPVEEAVDALASDMVKVQRRISREGKYSLDLSGQVLQVINRALAEKPSQRFPSVGEFNQSLQAALGAIVLPQPQVVRETSPVPVEYRPQRKKRSKLIAPILTGIAVLGVVITIALAQWVDLSEPVIPTQQSVVSNENIIELPDQSENSGLTRDPNSVGTPNPPGSGIIGKASPTPTFISTEGQSQPTSPPQSTNPPSSQPTATNPPSGTETSTPGQSETPSGSETPTVAVTPTPTEFEPTGTPEPSNTPTDPPPTNTSAPPTIDPNKCNYNNDKSPHYCTPTP
jgi:serine/threonine-protein kinase